MINNAAVKLFGHKWPVVSFFSSQDFYDLWILEVLNCHIAFVFLNSDAWK